MKPYRITGISKTVENWISNDEMSQASKHSKIVFFEWKSDRLNNGEKSENGKATKRLLVLRRAQRRGYESRKNSFIYKIKIAC